MNKRKWISGLCLVLALSVALQNTAMAAELALEEQTASLFAEAEETQEEAEPTEEGQDAGEDIPVPEEEEPEEEVASQPVEDDTPEKEQAEETTPQERGEAVPAADADTEQEPLPLEGQEEEPAEGNNTGWQEGEAGSLTFWYRSDDGSQLLQAKDLVLYLPVDTTFADSAYQAGYYYFDETGSLILSEDGKIGTVQAVKVDEISQEFVQDDAYLEAGKLMQVSASTEGTTVISQGALYSGKYSVDSLWYSNGERYTGFYPHSNGKLYYVTDGVGGTTFTGKYAKSNQDVFGDTVFNGDGLWYSNGKLYTGFYPHSNGKLYYVTKGVGGTAFTGKYAKSKQSKFGSTTFQGDGLYYYGGKLFTGYWYCDANGKVYDLKNGVGGTLFTGIMSTSKYYYNSSGKRTKGNGKCYSKGLLYTGGYQNYYYKKGVKQTGLSGWKTFTSSGSSSSKSSDNTYYFTSNGKYVTGWKILTRNGTKYKFYFKSDGTLCKNIYKINSAFKKRKTKIVVSRSTHTCTMYAYSSDTKSYSIPCKSFVVSTSKLESNFHVGTYKVTKRQAWFPYGQWWYKWATYVGGSGSYFHSEQYRKKGNARSLNTSSYNNLGTNQSKLCIRCQVVNCKLIYDMYSSIKQVVFTKSSNAGPFGKMTLKDNVDRIGTISTTYDPTDPAI